MNLGKIGMSDTSYKTKLKDMFTHNDDKCYTTTERRDKYVGCICQKGWFFISLIKVLIPMYCLGLLLSIKQDDLLVGVWWDAAGVTTGSITVPLILSLGLGIWEEKMKIEWEMNAGAGG